MTTNVLILGAAASSHYGFPLAHDIVQYNQRRGHAALGSRTPSERCGVSVSRRAELRHFVWRSDCAGLFHTPIAA